MGSIGVKKVINNHIDKKISICSIYDSCYNNTISNSKNGINSDDDNNSNTNREDNKNFALNIVLNQLFC